MSLRRRSTRALRVAAALLLAGGAVAWWWLAREDGASRIEPPAARAMTEPSIAPPPIAPVVERTPDEIAAPPSPSATPRPSWIAAASPLLEPDRVVVVSGVVVAAEGGAPIEGAELSVRGDGWGRVNGEAETDEQGRYELRLEGGVPARVRIKAAAKGFSFGETRLDVEPDAMELRADFRLRKGFEVAVEVVRALDGAPVPFAHVMLFQDGWLIDLIHDGVTGEAGRWVERDIGDLPRQDLSVLVEAERFARRHVRSLALPEEGDRLELRCELSPPRSLTGIVVAQGGGPIAGAIVSLVSMLGEVHQTGTATTCDEQGRFTLEASEFLEEAATLTVSAEGFTTVILDRPWAVDGGFVTIVLPVPTARWRGRVVDRATGRGVVGGSLFARQRGASDCGLSVTTNGELDQEGRFELPIVAFPAAGAIELRVHANGYAWRLLELPLPLESAAALPPTIEIERHVTIRGRVLDAASEQPVRAEHWEAPIVYVSLEQSVGGDGRAHDLEYLSLGAKAYGDGSYSLELPLSIARTAGRCSFVIEHGFRRIPLGRLDLRPHLDRAAPGEPIEIVLDLPIDASPRPVGEPK